MKKQLAVAALLITISAGLASADYAVPSRRCAVHTTVTASSGVTAKVQAAWNYFIRSFAKW